ncbi:5-carboxymethyl-2-hydroxymuconate Delta-isomerase [Mesorhizobium sp. ISC25]|uniref:5-carboxymethyl-2-hydroxymuconate Delta-isomerase n=1 Tax=Mesorhizobium sp. ISC25 TaxID=3077335 RepID=UPI0035DC568B
MPHFTAEYSGNLDQVVDMAAFCECIRVAMLDTGLFELGAVRVRALRAQAYAIADALPQNGFVDMSLRIGAGRSAQDKQRAGELIFEAATEFFAAQFATAHFALSLEIREIDPTLSWKRNSIHPRLRGQ